MKKVNKPRKKEPKKMGEKKKRILAEAMLAEGLQQDDQKVEDAPNGNDN